MKYFPILQELFESDTIIFLSIGIAIAVIIGLSNRNRKMSVRGIVVSLVIYLICEATSNIHTNYMIEFVLLVLGTMAIGGCVGFISSTFINLLRKSEV